MRRAHLLGMLAAAALLAGVVPPANASARRRTAETVFRAFRPNGRPSLPTRARSGSCFTGSIAIDRRDAWRCTVGNELYDPCFSSPRARRVVVCPDVELAAGVEIRLTRGLPLRYGDHRPPSLREPPWNVELADGAHCLFAAGATSVVGGERLNYVCDAHRKLALWGLPRRGTEPWSILTAPFSAKHLHRRVALRHVWM